MKHVGFLITIPPVYVLITLLINSAVSIDVAAERKKCLVDETVPEYPVNVYYCEDPVKTECCVEEQEGSCCEPKESITM